MIPILAQDLTAIWPQLMDLWVGFAAEGSSTPGIPESRTKLGEAIFLCQRLCWDDLEDQARRLLERIEEGQSGIAIEALVDDLKDAFWRKISDLRIGIVEHKDIELYEGAATFLCGGKLHPDLSVSEEEINLSGRALAFGLSTAAVVHAMRSVEAGLHALCQSLGISFPAPVQLQDWRVLTEKIQAEKSKWEQQSRTPQKTDKLKWLSELILPADSFRLAWRNHVAHAREKYEEPEARKILGHVGDYLRKISDGL